jgi:hypothetical protein
MSKSPIDLALLTEAIRLRHDQLVGEPDELAVATILIAVRTAVDEYDEDDWSPKLMHRLMNDWGADQRTAEAATLLVEQYFADFVVYLAGEGDEPPEYKQARQAE